MKTENVMNSKRLLALDVLRGITIAGMLLVNNPGSWGRIYAPLKHASWNGLTPTDLVFPFFMFIMGISTYISLRKTAFTLTGAIGRKIVKRSLLIWLIGLSVAWLSLTMRGMLREEWMDLTFFERLWNAATQFDHLRILGVMPRLGICYGVASLVAITVKHKHIPYLILSLLVGYFFVLVFGNGFEQDVQHHYNVLLAVDKAILGTSHMYGAGRVVEPEGILSTIPSIAHVLIGFCCGRLLMEEKDLNSKIELLFIIGTILTFTGFLLSYGCPINKKIWSPTYALVTCGLASTLLALLIWVIDKKGYKKWTHFFQVFGVNPLFLYVLGGVLAIFLGCLRMPFIAQSISIKSFIYKLGLVPLLGKYPASLLFALLFVSVCWWIGLQLFKRKIYIKI
jgi:predicted acyltransferase